MLKAKKQLEAALKLIGARRTNPGPVLGAVIVTNRLRYLKWDSTIRQWIAYLNGAQEPHITARMQENARAAKPTLQTDRIYLLDGSDDGLPVWNIVKGSQPFTIYEHDRSVGNDRGTFRPLRFGLGTIEVYFVS
jgi:hypothetical protein